VIAIGYFGAEIAESMSSSFRRAAIEMEEFLITDFQFSRFPCLLHLRRLDPVGLAAGLGIPTLRQGAPDARDQPRFELPPGFRPFEKGILDGEIDDQLLGLSPRQDDTDGSALRVVIGS